MRSRCWKEGQETQLGRLCTFPVLRVDKEVNIFFHFHYTESVGFRGENLRTRSRHSSGERCYGLDTAVKHSFSAIYIESSSSDGNLAAESNGLYHEISKTQVVLCRFCLGALMETSRSPSFFGRCSWTSCSYPPFGKLGCPCCHPVSMLRNQN